MRHKCPLRWPLYRDASRVSWFQLRMTESRQAHDESAQDDRMRRKGSSNPVPRRCARLKFSKSALRHCLRLLDKELGEIIRHTPTLSVRAGGNMII